MSYSSRISTETGLVDAKRSTRCIPTPSQLYGGRLVNNLQLILFEADVNLLIIKCEKMWLTFNEMNGLAHERMSILCNTDCTSNYLVRAQ